MSSIHLSMKHKNKKKFSSDCFHDQLSSVVIRARALAAKRGIDFPKRVNFGGDCGGLCYMTYKKNTTRDLLVEVLKARRIAITKVEW